MGTDIFAEIDRLQDLYRDAETDEEKDALIVLIRELHDQAYTITTLR